MMICISLKLLGIPEPSRYPPGRGGNRNDVNDNMLVPEASKNPPGNP